PGVEVRAADLRPFSAYRHCMMHAKYLVVDSRAAVIGSHNWSFGGFADNRELSLVIEDAALARSVRAVFDADWSTAQGRCQKSEVRMAESQVPHPGSLRLAVAGPEGLVRPDDWRLTDALAEVVARAESTLDVEVNSISPRVDFGPARRFGLVESLLAAAAGRGVKVRLLVDRWAREQEPEFLRDLDAVAGIEARVADISRAGPSPGTGTLHAKFVLADRVRVLLGTATMSQRQLTECRNLAVVLEDPGTARTLFDLFEQDWFSVYTRRP
ncbi:hypothetical protein FJY71_06070, partial [candidate division WOR-3 bacterium]|nr:hypothetical protein [candidate division WOR-3 bacterium]